MGGEFEGDGRMAHWTAGTLVLLIAGNSCDFVFIGNIDLLVILTILCVTL